MRGVNYYCRAADLIVAAQAPYCRTKSAFTALSWTRDPFDRLIVAQAAVRDARLITKDRVLRKRYGASLW